MFKLLAVMFVLAGVGSFAFSASTKSSADSIFERISEGSEEFVPQTFTNESVQQMVMEDMLINCKDGLCTIYSVSNSGDEFKTEFNVGVGSTGTASASTVGPNVGISLTYTKKNCTQKIQIPRSLYLALNTYFFHFVNEDSGTRKTFNPADEAMMIMFSTIRSEAKGCN